MFSAAAIHELTTVNPMNISITIPMSMAKPKLPEYPPVEIYSIAYKNLELGIENYQIEVHLHTPVVIATALIIYG